MGVRSRDCAGPPSGGEVQDWRRDPPSGSESRAGAGTPSRGEVPLL